MFPREGGVGIALRGEQLRQRGGDDLPLLYQHGAGTYLLYDGGYLRGDIFAQLLDHLSVGLQRGVEQNVKHLKGDVAFGLRELRLLEVFPDKGSLLLTIRRFVADFPPDIEGGLDDLPLRSGALPVIYTEQRRVEELFEFALFQQFKTPRDLKGDFFILHHDVDDTGCRALAQFERRRPVLVARGGECEVCPFGGDTDLVVLPPVKHVPVDAYKQRRDTEEDSPKNDVLPVFAPE